MPASVPETIDEALSPAWLTAALSPRFPGIRVVDVEPGEVVARVSMNARFRIECEGGVPDGLSPYLCLKGYFHDFASRAAGASEVAFYRELADRCGVRTLRCVYAEIDPDTQHGVLITEDVVEAGGVFLDGTSAYSADQVAESLSELAKLHAHGWCNPDITTLPWLTPRMARTLEARGEDVIKANFESPTSAGVPQDACDAHRVVEAYRRVIAEVEAAPRRTVIHADPHIGNVFLDGEGRPSFLDWQIVQSGPWYIDVGYHIGSALPVEERRRHERDLLRHYLDEVTKTGVPAPSFDDGWRSLRSGVLHGFFLWAITLKVAPEVTAVLLQRLGTAVVDHGALADVG